MKIFNIENGKEKVYVQLNDIAYLNNTDISIPASIYYKVFQNPTIITDSNRMGFVMFDEPHELEFFKKADFILDYNNYKKSKPEELVAKGQEFLDQYMQKAEKYNSMLEEEKKQNQQLVDECNNLGYMIKYIREIYWLRIGRITMPFPQVSASDGFKFVGSDDCLYEMSESLNPNVLYLYRKDGKSMSDQEIIPQDFLQSGLSLAIMQKHDEDFFIGDFSTSSSLSEDKTKLIITFTYQEYSDKKASEEKQCQEKGVRKITKLLFRKRVR